MIYPSGRAVWAGAAGVVPVFIVALAYPAVWYLGLIWICILLAFLAVDAVAAPARTALAAEVVVPTQAGIGRRFSAHVEARFAGAAPHPIQARLGHDSRVAPVKADGGVLVPHDAGAALDLEFQPLRRGLAAFDTLWLRWRGPFGLVWKQAVLPVERAVAVLPDVAQVRDEALTLLRRDTMSDGRLQRRRINAGREFEALTDYRPGMGRRMIDWKRSARHGKLLAREFRTEENNTIVLAIDSGRLMSEPVAGVPKVDRAVTAALLSAFIALKGGDLVSLFGFDSRPRLSSGSVRGAASFAMLQRLAAQIDYSTEETNFTLALSTMAAKLERRSLVVIFTDFVDPISAELMLRVVGRLTERHLVLFMLMKDEELETLADGEPKTGEDVARAVVAGNLLRERQVVIGRLRMLGADVVEAGHQRLGLALVDRYLRLKRDDRL